MAIPKLAGIARINAIADETNVSAAKTRTPYEEPDRVWIPLTTIIFEFGGLGLHMLLVKKPTPLTTKEGYAEYRRMPMTARITTMMMLAYAPVKYLENQSGKRVLAKPF